MKTIELKAVKRETIGKKETRELRAQGLVPCVIYGEKENLHFAVSQNDLTKVVYTPNVYIVSVEIGSTKTNCILQEVQYDPISSKPIHVDFLPVFADKKLSIKIPVKLTGVSKGVQQGGKLQVKMRKIKVAGFPKSLPDTLDIDITELGAGQSIKMDALSFENLEILDAKNAVVCAVKLTRSAVKDKAPTGKK